MIVHYEIIKSNKNKKRENENNNYRAIVVARSAPLILTGKNYHGFLTEFNPKEKRVGSLGEVIVILKWVTKETEGLEKRLLFLLDNIIVYGVR